MAATATMWDDLKKAGIQRPELQTQGAAQSDRTFSSHLNEIVKHMASSGTHGDHSTRTKVWWK